MTLDEETAVMNAWRAGRSASKNGHAAEYLVLSHLRQRELGELEAYGVQFVQVTSDEDPSRCPRCALFRGVIMPLARAPRLPVNGCRGECTCRLSPLGLE